jgi:hypothetical protein
MPAGACTASQFYENWGPYLNFAGSNQFYVQQDTSTTWNDRADGDVIKVICEQWLPSPTTWPQPANPPARGCRPGNTSTFVSFANENYGWQLYLQRDGFNNHRFKCRDNNVYLSGGRMLSPRSHFQQWKVESYFARTNPTLTQYWLGIKQSTIGSRTKYKFHDGISYTVRCGGGGGGGHVRSQASTTAPQHHSTTAPQHHSTRCCRNGSSTNSNSNCDVSKQ